MGFFNETKCATFWWRVRSAVPRTVPEFPNFNATNSDNGRTFPALNAWEEQDDAYVEAEVPGLVIENLDIQVKKDELTIAGERKVASDEGTKYHRRERGTGTLSPSRSSADRG